jgi:hypothetical protein
VDEIEVAEFALVQMVDESMDFYLAGDCRVWYAVFLNNGHWWLARGDGVILN